MSIARIIWIISMLAAIVLALPGVATGFNSVIIAVLGLVSGWFVDKEHRLGLLVAAIFLMNGGAGALGSIPNIGEILTAILGSIGSVLGAAGVMAVLKRLVERLFLGKGLAD